MADDSQLLEDLARELQRPVPLDWGDFAAQTEARLAQEKQWPLARWRPDLTPLRGGGLVTLVLLIAWWRLEWLSLFGVSLGVAVLVLSVLPHLDSMRPPRSQDVFYVLPAWAVLATTGVLGMAEVPYFAWRYQMDIPTPSVFVGLVALPVMFGLALLLWLTRPLLALEPRCLGNLPRLLAFQLACCLWTVGVESFGYPLLLKPLPHGQWVLQLLFALAVSGYLARQSSPDLCWLSLEKEGRQAGRRLLAAVTILSGFGLVGSLWMLPLKLDQPALYAEMLSRGQKLDQELRSISPDDNAWTLLQQEIFSNPQRYRNQSMDPFAEAYFSKEQDEQARTRALALAQAELKGLQPALPLIKKALQRPILLLPAQNSPGNPWLQERSLHFRLYGFTVEAVRAGHLTEALEHFELLLRQAQIERSESTFWPLQGRNICQCLMILLEAHPDRPQLQRLLSAILKADNGRQKFGQATLLTLYRADQRLREIQKTHRFNLPESPERMTERERLALPFAQLVPARYWESARLDYFNTFGLQLQEADWMDVPIDHPIGLPGAFDVAGYSPSKSQVNFRTQLAFWELAKAVAALELYQSEHGKYPASLDQLVPRYLPAVPVNALSPRRWNQKPTLDYALKGNGYVVGLSSPHSAGFTRNRRLEVDTTDGYRLEER